MRRLCRTCGVGDEKKEDDGKLKKKSKAELVADLEKEAADRERKREQAKARGKAFGQALPADEVSRPSDEERKDYDAMTLKEKNAFGSARFA